MRKFFLTLVFLPLFFLIPTLIFLDSELEKKLPHPKVTFEVHPGESFASVHHRLIKKNVVHFPRLFYYYARLKKYTAQIKAGHYEIPAKASLKEVLELLTRGETLSLVKTIVEGSNLYDIAQIFEEAQFCSQKEFLALAHDQYFIAKIFKKYASFSTLPTSLEGFLFPNTYHFTHHCPRNIEKMVGEFFKQIALPSKVHQLNSYEILTLASIIEKETARQDEYHVISGVFHNRLKKGMKLQSDPTIIYGILHRDQKFNGNITKKDILSATPFNTYKIKRLPPHPICNPGKRAIMAAINPERNHYLFFVSNNRGKHIFSKTYAEHRQAVRKFQK